MNKLEKAMEKEALKRIKQLQSRFNINNTMEKIFESSNIMTVDFTSEEDIEKKEYDIDLCFEIVQEFTAKYNARVYYIFIENMTIGNYSDKIINILYVSSNKEEWEIEQITKNNEILAYTYNLSLNMHEFGFITLKKKGNDIGRIN